jgi:hypothetical protein
MVERLIGDCPPSSFRGKELRPDRAKIVLERCVQKYNGSAKDIVAVEWDLLQQPGERDEPGHPLEVPEVSGLLLHDRA